MLASEVQKLIDDKFVKNNIPYSISVWSHNDKNFFFIISLGEISYQIMHSELYSFKNAVYKDDIIKWSEHKITLYDLATTYSKESGVIF